MRRAAEDSLEFWHAVRSKAHLLHLAAYSDALCVASKATDTIQKLVEILQFDNHLHMVLFNHGKNRSFTSVLRRQLTPAVALGTIRFDCKYPYYLALVAGAGGWLHPAVTDVDSLCSNHPAGLHTGGFIMDPFAMVLADIRTGKGHVAKTVKAKKAAMAKQSASADANCDISPPWSGIQGGLLLLHHGLPWPVRSVQMCSIVRLVEAPSTKMLMELSAASGDEQGRHLPPSQPVAPRSKWAFTDGGHQLASLLELAFVSTHGHSSAVELTLRMQKGKTLIALARNARCNSMVHFVQVTPLPTARILLPSTSNWPPPEHRVDTVEHKDSASLVATAVMWLKGQLVTLEPLETAGANFDNVQHFVPKVRP